MHTNKQILIRFREWTSFQKSSKRAQDCSFLSRDGGAHGPSHSRGRRFLYLPGSNSATRGQGPRTFRNPDMAMMIAASRRFTRSHLGALRRSPSNAGLSPRFAHGAIAGTNWSHDKAHWWMACGRGPRGKLRIGEKSTPPRAFFFEKRAISCTNSCRFQPESRAFFPDSYIWKKTGELLFTNLRSNRKMKL